MNRKLLPCAVMLALLTFHIAAHTLAQQGAPSAKAQVTQPGPAHKVLEQRAGAWKMLYRIYAAPGQPPIELPAKGELTMIFGGRFLKVEMSAEGPWKGTAGLGIEGYDNFKQSYFFHWVDSSGTRTISLTGTADESGQVITYLGEIDDADSGTKGVKVRVVVRMVGPDEHTFEFFQTPPGGKESKPFDITYKRA